MSNILDSQKLAQQTTDEILNKLNPENNDSILDALKTHYEVLNRTQQMHIDFLSEFIDNLKKLQTKDKESLDNLKKQVLSHILKNQTK